MDDIENFTAKIGAKIRDFQNKMKQVDKKVRETAMETSKPINADINEFYTQMAAADAQAKQVLKRGEKQIDADASDFMRKAAEVAVVSRTLSQRIIVPIELRINKFQASIARIAQNTRAFGELGQTTVQGVALAFSSTLVPVIATTAGLIGQLGPLLGTVAGSTFALGSAFVTAGIGAGAFGAIAVTNLKDIFAASSELKKLREKMAKTDDLKERNKIMEEMKRIQGSLTDEQLKALGAMDKLKDTWSGIAKGLESKTIDIFTQSLGIFGGVLTTLEPMFISVTDAAKRLTDSFGAAINAEPMQKFFDYLNTTAGPMFETMTKGMGNFGLGILNLITAFSPLTKTTSDSFLSMSESFANWTAGLSENKKFNNFVDYVKENMPKISSIFGDAFQGIINIFAAFAPSSADMMTSLQDMMERFREWSAQLAESQGFKNFINYITANGPKVVEAIGNITTFLIELGKALAPMGAYLLDVVNSVISWTNELMKNHPWLGKILAAVVVITGALIAIAPNIIAFGALFGGAAKGVMAATSLMRAKFVTGMAMMVTSMVKTATAMVVNTAKMIAQWVIMGTKSTIQAVKVAAAWALSTGKAMATAVASMVVAAAKVVGRWVFMGAQALIQAGRMAAAWFIALGPIGWVIAAIVGLAILIIANWDKIKAKTIEIWTKVWSSVKEAAAKMVTYLVQGIAKMVGKISEFAGKVLAFRADMLSAGKNLIQGLIDGILGMGSKAIQSVKDLGSNVISAAKGIFGIKSPSRVFSKIGYYIGTGLAIGVSDTTKANEKVMNDLGKVMISVAKVSAAEIATVNKQASTEQNAIAKKATAQIAEIHAVAHDYKRKLTTHEVRKIAKIENDADASIRASKIKHSAEIKAIEEQSASDRLSAIQKFVDNKNKLEGLSAIQEANIWRKAADSFKAGTQEKIDALSKYRDTLQRIQSGIESTNEKYSQRMIDINQTLTSEIEKVNADLVANSKAAKDKLIADEQRLNDAYSSTLEDRYNSLRNFAGLFDKFDMSPKESGTDLLNNLQSQVDGFKSWESEITKLSAKGINEGLLDELRDMGPKALPQLLALNSMTSEQLTQYSALFSEKSALARAEAEEQLIGMKADTQRQITELRAVTNAELTRLKDDAQLRIAELRAVAKTELATLQVDWINDIAKITKSTNEQFKTLTQIGKDAVAGLISGMKSMQGPLQAEAKAIADSVQKTIKSALKIHSPSRVLEKLGEYAGLGLVGGLSNSIGKVMAISRELASAATPVLAGVQMAPIDTQSQMDSLHRQIKQELSVDMDVNHKGQGGVNRATGGNTYILQVEPSRIQELNDVIRLFDQQNWDSE